MPTDFDANGLLRQSSKIIYISKKTPLPYLRSPLWAAGFSFSSGNAMKEVPYDPELPFLFFGEELSMAIR